MRFVPLTALIAALALTMASVSADAKPRKRQHNGDWVRLHITVNKHRSFLDSGTSVQPGTMYYHNYVNLLQSRFPTYGPVNDGRDSRWPMPLPYELPGY
jgi:hypothetical protein